MKQNKPMGYLAITIVAIIYGVSYVARNIITRTGAMDASVITFLQLAIMMVLFLAYNLITHRSLKVQKKDLPVLILSGLFGTFLFQTFTNLSVASAGAGIPSLLFGMAPVFALIISAIFFKKKTVALSWISVVVGLVGLYIITGITPESFADTNIAGYVLSLASVLCWVIYCFMSDRASDGYDKCAVLFWQALVGTVASAPFLFLHPMNMEAFSANMGSIIGALLILGVVNSTIAYFLNIYAIKQIGVNLANVFLNFMPIATLVAVYFVDGVAPPMSQIVGGVIIIASVLMLSYAEKLSEAKNAKV